MKVPADRFRPAGSSPVPVRQRVGIRIEAVTLTFFDLDTRQLLRTRADIS